MHSKYQVSGIVLLHLLALFLMQPAQAQEVKPRSYQAIATDTSITIDGTLNEQVWQQGDWQTGFVLLDSGDTPAPRQTSIKISHDDKAIYLAAKVERMPDQPLKADATARDIGVYNDDSIEFMLAASGRAEYAHFIVNSKGVLFDEWRHQGGSLRSIEWNSSAKSAARVYDDYWTVELAVPFADLGISNESNGDWYFNVCRSEHTRREDSSLLPVIHSSFSPGFAGFNQPRYFAALTLDSPKIDNYLWQIESPVNGNIVLNGDKYVYHADLFLVNQTPRYQFVTVDAEILREDTTGGATSIGLGLDTEDAANIPLAIPLERTGRSILRITVRDRKNGTARASRDFPLLLEHNPIAIHITQPAYRQTIYATQNLKQIEGAVRVNLTQEDIKQYNLEIRLENGATTLSSQVIDQVSESVPFSLSTESMEIGEYEIVVNARNKQNEITSEARKSIRKVGPPPAGRWEVRLDEHLVTLVNGKPILPYGWFSIPESKYAEHVADGCNILIDYNVSNYNPEAQKAFLDKALAAGLRVLLNPYPTKMVYSEAGKLPLSDEDAEIVRELVRRLSKHPAVFGWYMADEPTSLPVLPARLQEIYRITREEDPYGPCVLLHDQLGALELYPDASDIQMPDPYPLFKRNGLALRAVDYISRFLNAIPNIPGDPQAKWVTPQGFNYGDFGLHGNRAPNFNEIRNQQYQSVVSGATGFVWYSRWYIQSYPELLTAMSFHTQEAQILKDAILAAEQADPVKIESPQEHSLMTSLRQVGQHKYLFVVNNATNAVDATLQLPGESPTRWHVVSENRVVEATSGLLKDHFEHYAVHIYTTDESAAKQLAVADAMRTIDRHQAEIIAKGNYAHRDMGATATVSGTAARFLERHLNDGITASDYGSDWVAHHEGWKSQTPIKDPEWVVITFDKSRTVSRIVVTSSTLDRGQVQIHRDNQWQDIADLDRKDGRTLTTEFPPVSCNAFRILIKSSNKPYVNIEEIEAYEN